MLYIRTDMNHIIATGHVMRCIAIAEAARRMGEEPVFILADLHAERLLKERGFSYIILNTKWNDMESELPVLENLIKERQMEQILIDSYQVTENYFRSLTSLVQTYYMDDVNAFLYPVTGIICYANYWEKFHYKERYKNTKLYLGTKYAPLRSVFCECKQKRINKRVEKILLLSGGTDSYHVLEQMLEGLDLKRYLQVNVICGTYNQQYDFLKKKSEVYSNVNIYQAVSDIEQYMMEADVVISAGGSTLYELCAVGVPTISYSIADNQLDNVRKFHEDGIIDYAGDVRSDALLQKIRYYLERFEGNHGLRQEKSRKMREMVDGKGAWRIAGLFTAR